MRLDRTIQSSFLKQVAMLVAVNAAVLLICFLIWGLSRGEWNLWMVYNNYIDTGNQAGAGNSERWIAVITSVFGSFLFGCLLISTLSNIIERRIDRYRSGLVRYRHSRHSVIIGADSMLLIRYAGILLPVSPLRTAGGSLSATAPGTPARIWNQYT